MSRQADAERHEQPFSTPSEPYSGPEEGARLPDELEHLWKDFKSTGSTEARDRLIVHYAPLVKFVAGRMSVGIPASIDHEDLTSAGIVGLMEAISKFEPGRGYKFETYAANRIRGAILDDLRAMDWVPRSVRTQARRVEETLQKLQEELRRTPSDEEVAAEMGVSVRKLRAIYSRISTVLFVSLERLLSLGEMSGTLSLIETLADSQAEDPVSHVETEEMKAFLAQAIGELPERERTAITLYYYEGLSLSEIAQVVGLSQARISQMNAKSVLQFRSLLNKGPKH
jgi:RNA polymerase sigma factor for flagellar operon FliA